MSNGDPRPLTLPEARQWLAPKDEACDPLTLIERPGGVPLGLHEDIGPPPDTRRPGASSPVRRWRRLTLGVAGCAGIAWGLLLFREDAPPSRVSLDSAGYHIGTVVLPPRGPDTFGDGPVVMIQSTSSGTQFASASLKWNGEHVAASCVQHGDREHCTFETDRRVIDADDVLERGKDSAPRAWLRTYSDGLTTRVLIDGNAVAPPPLPLPVGH